MYIGFEQEDVSNAVKTSADLNIPPKATHAELQAGANPIAYTMDNATNPTTSLGMILPAASTANPPRLVLIEDLKRIRFIRFGANDTTLNIHYIAGRDI